MTSFPAASFAADTSVVQSTVPSSATAAASFSFELSSSAMFALLIPRVCLKI
jgi:hypothetical protein